MTQFFRNHLLAARRKHGKKVTAELNHESSRFYIFVSNKIIQCKCAGHSILHSKPELLIDYSAFFIFQNVVK